MNVLRPIFILVTLTSILLSSVAKPTKDLWSGKYVQENGLQDLFIVQYGNALSVDIMKAGQPKDEMGEGSHFFAFIKGKVATFDDHDGCRCQLIRKTGGILIKDHCSGAGRDNGLYRKVD